MQILIYCFPGIYSLHSSAAAGIPRIVQGRCSPSPLSSIKAPSSIQAGVNSLIACAQFAAMISLNQPGLAFVSYNAELSECGSFSDCVCLASDLCEGGQAWKSGKISELTQVKLAITIGPDGMPIVSHEHANVTSWEDLLAKQRRAKEASKGVSVDLSDGRTVALVVISGLMLVAGGVIAVGEYYKAKFERD